MVYRLRLALTSRDDPTVLWMPQRATSQGRGWVSQMSIEPDTVCLLKIHSTEETLKDTSKDRHRAILFSLVSNQWFQTNENNLLQNSFC